MSALPTALPYGRQSIVEADIAAVVEVLRGDWLTQGPAVPAFENAVAKYCHISHAVAANSATSALHLACLALRVGPGDIVWTTPNTFVASANCALYCGAEIDFVDIDPGTFNMCPEKLSAKLTEANRSGRLPKVVIPVHFGGQSCDMAAIGELAKKFGFRIIEDASHAIGGRYRGKPVGSGEFSDITVFSFHPVKIITTAEGGMAVTNDADLAKAMRLFRSHGVTRDTATFVQKSDGPWSYEQQVLGFNYRMTDLQAALGLSQMERLDLFVAKRQALAGRYATLLEGLPLSLQEHAYESVSAFHLMVVRLHLEEMRISRSELVAGLQARNISTNVHYKAVHTQPYYQSLGFSDGDFPTAERYAKQTLSLPLYPTLTEWEQDHVAQALKVLLTS